MESQPPEPSPLDTQPADPIDISDAGIAALPASSELSTDRSIDSVPIEPVPVAITPDPSTEGTIPERPVSPIRPKQYGVGVVLLRLLIGAAFGVVITASLLLGLQLRVWTWEQTGPIHFYPDIYNGIHWGSVAGTPENAPHGLLNVYDVVAANAGVKWDAPDYGLDYAPLRLTLMTHWVQWARSQPDKQMDTFERSLEYGGALGKRDAPFALFEPTLRFNEATEIIAAIGLFVLTRYWSIRGQKRLGSTCRAGFRGAVFRPFHGCFAGLLAALIFWFSPAVLLSTHGWPTWDEWIIPFFVWAIFLACTDWWFAAGLVIAVGAMFKGQQLFVAPLFVLWPLLIGKWESSLRWIAGLVVGVTAIAAPWMLTYVPSGATENTIAADRRIAFPAVMCASAVLTFLLALPFLLRISHRQFGFRQRPSLFRTPRYSMFALFVVALTIILTANAYSGSFTWVAVGWGYGLHHYFHMTQGLSDNLAGVLHRYFGWRELTDPVFTLNPMPIRLWPSHTVLFDTPTVVVIRMVLVALYVITFIPCVIAMAIQARRNDPNFLIGMTGVWLMFFTWMPQIHERYLLYAGCVGCTLTAVGVGMTLLDFFMLLLTAVMTIHVMLSNAQDGGRLGFFSTNDWPNLGFKLKSFCDGTFPDAGWAVMLTAVMFLFLAFRRSPVTRHG